MRSSITVRRFLRKRSRGCVYAETCVYARGCVYAPPVYTHPPFAYTHRPAYTHPGAYMHPLRIHTHHSRKRTCPRIRTRVCIRTRCVQAPTARVNAPIRVYAPEAVYTRGCDERHVSLWTAFGLRRQKRARFGDLINMRIICSLRRILLFSVPTPFHNT